MAYSKTHKAYLAYTKVGRPTGRSMAKALGIEFGVKPPERALDVLIRWGSRKPMPGAALVLNNPEAIRKASNKVEAFRAMQYAGVSTVPFMEGGTLWEAMRKFGGGQHIFGRDKFGSRGKDIVVYEEVGYRDEPTEAQMRQIRHDFFTMFVNSTREVRIHVVEDQVVRIQGKYLDFPEKAKTRFINNYENGYRFRTPKQELHRDRKQQAVMAVKACGLDFGAVDMLLTGNGRASYVLEVNTAPACSPLTMRCYAAAISLMVSRRTEGEIQLAPDILAAEMLDMPEDLDQEERYI